MRVPDDIRSLLQAGAPGRAVTQAGVTLDAA
jgi:hypothetical protein